MMSDLSTSDDGTVELRWQDPFPGANRFGRIERAAGYKHRQAVQQSLLFGSKQRVTPIDGRSQGLVTRFDTTTLA